MYFCKWISQRYRLLLVSTVMLSMLLLGSPALAQADGEYCVVRADSGGTDECFSSFQSAFNALRSDAHGRDMRLSNQVETYWSPSWDANEVYDVIRYTYKANDLPPQEFLSAGYSWDPGGDYIAMGCTPYKPPTLNNQLCASEGDLINGYASIEMEGGVTATPNGVSGAWNTVEGYGVWPWETEEQGDPQYGVVIRGGKTASFTITERNGNQWNHELPYYKTEPYRCPMGMYPRESRLDDWEQGSEPPQDKCRDGNDYTIVKTLTLSCAPCEEGGVSLSRGTQTVRESLLSLDGVDIELAYGSASRSWSLGFDKKIYEGVDAPLLEVSPGLFARLKSIGTSNYAIEGRPNELVWFNSDATYSYRAGGYEYRFDLDGRVASFGAIGTMFTKVTRDDEGKIISLKTPNGRVVSFTYTESKLTSISGGGYSVGIVYDSYNNISEINGDDGQLRKFLYGESGLAAGSDINLLTGILSGTGQREKSFSYDVSGRLTRRSSGEAGSETSVETYAYPNATHATVITASGGTRTYEFANDTYRRPISIADAAGTIANEYDAESRLAKRTDALGSITTFGYAPLYESSRTIAVGSAQQRRVETDRDTKFDNVKARRIYNAAGVLVSKEAWTYNTRGQVLTVTRIDPVTNLTRTTTTTYCESADVTSGVCPRTGLLKTVDGPRTDVSDATSYVYYPSDDATCASAPATCPHRKGDLWKVANALNQVTEVLRYDASGHATSVRDANGVVTDYEYHPRGWLSASKIRGVNDAEETDDVITRLEYWPTGLVKKVIQPDGAFTTYTYDAAGRLTDIGDNTGNTLHYTLNNAGNRIKEDTKDAQGNLKRTLSRVFNQLGQLKTLADAQANPTDFTYDANGNSDTVTDGLGRISDNDHDPLNRLARTLQDVGGIEAETKFEYDALDNLTKVTDPKGLDTTYVYNGLGDLAQLNSPDTGNTTYTYDSAGNRKTQTDARGIQAEYAYDALNRLAGVTYAADPALNVIYQYDVPAPACGAGETFAVGQLSQMSDGSGSTQYCYGRFGYLARKVQTTNGQAFTLRYAYNAAGQLSGLTYPDGAIVDYVRNAQGQVIEVGVSRAGSPREVLLGQASYAPFGPLTSWSYGNGRTLNRAYNQNYQPIAIQDTAMGGLDLGFGFDAVGNLTQLTPAANPAVLIASFDYDALNRLTTFRDQPTNVVIESYTYDKTGNRTSFSNSAGTQIYTYPNGSHHLDQVGGVVRIYDAAGNTTAIGGKGLGYNAANRLASVSNGATIARRYAYNEKGEQVHRQTDISNSYAIYDEAGHWLGDYADGGTAVQQAIWLDDMPVGLLSSSQLYYIEPDHLGTPRAVIDPIRNVAVWTWALKGEIFGDSAPNTDPDGDSSPFVFDLRFPGQRYDSATGMNYNYFRDYDASGGRYVQSDPIGLSGGISTYAYAFSNPSAWIDPSGRQAAVPIPTGSGAAGAASAAGAYNPGLINLDDIGPKISGEDVTTFIQAVNTISLPNLINPNSGINTLAKELVRQACNDDDDDECERLNQEVQRAKVTTGNLGKCRAGMSWGQLAVRKKAWVDEGAARSRRDTKCWNGGDPGHQQAQAQAWQNAGVCGSLMSGM